MGCFMSRLEIEADGRTYRMRKLIASGGFSQIYEADDIEKSTKVAVKKMICHSKSDIDRVRREVDVHRRFQGAPHIISLLGVAEDEFKLGSNGSRVTMFSLIFPLCRSGSVQDELDRRKTPREFMDEGRVLLLLRQLCSALEMLHDSNPTIAHRDLKPGNLLFHEDDQLQLIDFGSAVECPIKIDNVRASRAMLDEAAELCTMPYRAPELFTCELGLTINSSVDIWSLGCVLYALCFFQSPFDEVYARGDSVALAVQSARLTFAKDGPFSTDLLQLISDLIKPSPSDRPNIGQVISYVDRMLKNSADKQNEALPNES